jgi:hypothetical protein
MQLGIPSFASHSASQSGGAQQFVLLQRQGIKILHQRNMQIPISYSMGCVDIADATEIKAASHCPILSFQCFITQACFYCSSLILNPNTRFVCTV